MLYAHLLYSRYNAIANHIPTDLSRATEFLWGDYTPSAFWWEPVEMCRKLALCGWVLVIGEEYEQARVLVAIFVSTAFLALHLCIQPLKRCATPRYHICCTG